MKTIIIFGGRGYVGRALQKYLSRYHVITCDPKDGGSNHLRADITKRNDMKEVVPAADIVINLVGLTPVRHHASTKYESMHVEGVRNIITNLRPNQYFIHVSALGAHPAEVTDYLRSKGRAEYLIRRSGKHFTILRPSLLLGHGHEFVSLAKKLAWTRLFPDFPATVQPLLVDDFAQMLAELVQTKPKDKIYEVIGPEDYTLGELMEQIYDAYDKDCYLIPEWLYKPPLWLVAGLRLGGFGHDQLIFTELSGQARVESEVMMGFTPIEDWLQELSNH